MSTHNVTELRDAWRAVESGHYASGAARLPLSATRGRSVWQPSPGERLLAVVGCAGGVGASTVALSLATATGAPARVVECCPSSESGFPAAASAELGVNGGWRRGSRGVVVLERQASLRAELPLPAPGSVEWTILDLPWSVLAGEGATWWSSLSTTLHRVVLVTNATVPGFRRLESCAEFLEGELLGVVVGPAANRWPRPVKVAAGGMSSLRLVPFPMDRRLQVAGLTPAPLPEPLLKAAENVLALVRKEPS